MAQGSGVKYKKCCKKKKTAGAPTAPPTKKKRKKKSEKTKPSLHSWAWHCKHPTLVENFHCVCTNGTSADLILFLERHRFIDIDLDLFAYALEQQHQQPMADVPSTIKKKALAEYLVQFQQKGRLPSTHVHFVDLETDQAIFTYCNLHPGTVATRSTTPVAQEDCRTHRHWMNPSATTVATATREVKWTMSTCCGINLNPAKEKELKQMMKFQAGKAEWNGMFYAVSDKGKDTVKKFQILCDVIVLLGWKLDTFLNACTAAREVTLLFHVVDTMNPDVLLLLLKVGCGEQVNVPDHVGFTPLMRCCNMEGQSRVCEDKEGNVQREKIGKLSTKRRTRLVEVLLEAGADPNHGMDSNEYEAVLESLRQTLLENTELSNEIDDGTCFTFPGFLLFFQSNLQTTPLSNIDLLFFTFSF